MPVIRSSNSQPEWMTWSTFGFTEITDAATFDLHFHDADEYWIILSGRACVVSENVEYTVGPQDILCTQMGEEHDILEILESPLCIFWFEDELRGLKRPGHLHRPDQQPLPCSSNS